MNFNTKRKKSQRKQRAQKLAERKPISKILRYKIIGEKSSVNYKLSSPNGIKLILFQPFYHFAEIFPILLVGNGRIFRKLFARQFFARTAIFLLFIIHATIIYRAHVRAFKRKPINFSFNFSAPRALQRIITAFGAYCAAGRYRIFFRLLNGVLAVTVFSHNSLSFFQSFSPSRFGTNFS